MGNRKAKYRELLADSDVLRWYRNVARGSLVTADVYLRRLGGFCGRHGLTPRELAAKGQKELENLLLDSVSELEEQGKAGGHIKSIVKAVKSWLSYNHCELKIKIKVKGAEDTPTLREERVPTKDELLSIFLAGDRKARAASALLAFAGLRLETLGNYGSDGIRIKDLPEIRIAGKRVEFERVPTMVMVRESLLLKLILTVCELKDEKIFGTVKKAVVKAGKKLASTWL